MLWIVYSLPERYYEDNKLCALMEKGEVWKFGEYKGSVEADSFNSARQNAKDLLDYGEETKLAVIPANPQVGMGATYSVGSDRYACTIRKISESGKTIWLSPDDDKLISGDPMSEQQKYTYETVWEIGERDWLKATLRQDGKYRLAGSKSSGVTIGVRATYRDPCF